LSTTRVRLVERATRRNGWGIPAETAEGEGLVATLGTKAPVERAKGESRIVEHDERRIDAARVKGSQLFMGESSALPSKTLAAGLEFHENPLSLPATELFGGEDATLTIE
jgi:hypothetical protein